jgi:hypothetical protein
VPVGAGLSSSAALETSVGLALTAVAGAEVDGVSLALAGQQAEHNYVGTQCGIMDQFVAAMGRRRTALLIDCRTLATIHIPLDAARAAVCICDTRVKHTLATSEYNTRRAECERGVGILKGVLAQEVRALRDVSVVINPDTGKIVHEVTPDGAVYFGANQDPGNTDETSKFPSAVALVWRWTGDDAFRDEMYAFAVSNLRYIFRELDGDNDGWPEGLGNVEREGMGEEKLDNTVYTIRGLRDLADLAASRGDAVTQEWATAKAENLERRFDRTWWYSDAAQQYADSLDDPGNRKVFQRHWIGVTPAEAEIVRPGEVSGPLAPLGHANALVEKREEPCYSGEFGLFHTGTGGTSAPEGNPGPTCDPAISEVKSERSVFTLNTSIMAVAEAALGRMERDQLQRYTTDNATVQLDPSVWELPGAMPEIAPSPDFGANIDKLFTERSMALQAWGTYGILWPVVHYELGVSPDMGRHRFTVVPQIPAGQRRVAGENIRLGEGTVDVAAHRHRRRLVTVVHQDGDDRLTIGAVLPDGAQVRRARLDGRRTPFTVVTTARGREVRVEAGRADGTTRLTVKLRRR